MMDPNARVNALRQWMDFANQNNMFGAGWHDSAGSHDPSGQRAQWAASMMQQDMGPGGQDFFNSPAPGYTPPQPVQQLAANSGFPLAPQDQQPQQRQPESTQVGMAGNFLRNLFSRR